MALIKVPASRKYSGTGFVPKHSPKATRGVRNRHGQYWIVKLNRCMQVVQVYSDSKKNTWVHGCGDEQGWKFDRDLFTIKWISQVVL